jgi:hypothetical protein
MELIERDIDLEKNLQKIRDAFVQDEILEVWWKQHLFIFINFY